MAHSLENLLVALRPDTLEAHRRRVAAWHAELARARESGRQPETSRTQAILSHHNLLNVLDGPRREEFLADLRVSIASPEPAIPEPDAEILQLAGALDDHFGFEPFSEDTDDAGPEAKAALNALRSINRSDLERAIANLPVLPAAAQRALHLLLADDWDARILQSIASSDPVLAAELVRVANSAAFGTRQEIKTLGHAISYIGSEHACRILIAVSVKRMFAAKGLHSIWNHSLDAAEVTRSLARLSRGLNPEEALLAGLVHDIGRLAMALLPQDFQRRSARLVANGCRLSQVESALCGVTHAELGANALQKWGFPKALVEGVRFHHKPERCGSSLAAALYLTELCTSPSEDLRSLARAKAAMDLLGLDAESVHRIEIPRSDLVFLQLEECGR